MKALALRTQRKLFLLSILLCVIAVMTDRALAAPKNRATRTTDGSSHTGRCCSLWDEAVDITESENPVPIVVTWSADYQSTAPMLIGLSLNHGPCTFYGPRFIPKFASSDYTSSSITFQWLIMPGDYGLKRGRNAITLCGGGAFGDEDTITLGFSTLEAHLEK